MKKESGGLYVHVYIHFTLYACMYVYVGMYVYRERETGVSKGRDLAVVKLYVQEVVGEGGVEATVYGAREEGEGEGGREGGRENPWKAEAGFGCNQSG